MRPIFKLTCTAGDASSSGISDLRGVIEGKWPEGSVECCSVGTETRSIPLIRRWGGSCPGRFISASCPKKKQRESREEDPRVAQDLHQIPSVKTLLLSLQEQ